jgi:hypothetical protein
MTNNQDLWGEVRESLKRRAGTVKVLKVKGHSTALDIQKGLSTVRKAFMNDCADAQAGEGAARAQLPPSVTLEVEALMEKATKVHRRLLTVAQIRFGENRHEFVRTPPQAPKATRPRWEKVFLTRAAESDHQVVRFGPRGSKAKCSICSKGGKVRVASRWLLTKCTVGLHEGVDGQQLHSSHHMAIRQGVRMCLTCGFYSVKRVVKLLSPCPGQATGVQKADLERWERGLPPKQVSTWPLQAQPAHAPG